MDEKQISNWDQLTSLLDKYKDCGCLFRGEHNDKNESLIPKVGRFDTKSGSARKTPYDVKDEERVFEEFKKAARPYISHEPKSEIEWLAVAQHHGLPTRLLDWTESLVAEIYFAISSTFDGMERGYLEKTI